MKRAKQEAVYYVDPKTKRFEKQLRNGLSQIDTMLDPCRPIRLRGTEIRDRIN